MFPEKIKVFLRYLEDNGYYHDILCVFASKRSGNIAICRLPQGVFLAWL